MLNNKKQGLSKYASVLILLGIIIISSLLSPTFLKTANLINIARQISIITILAFGQTLIIINGEIDLSLGTTAGMVGTFACVVFIATQSLILTLIFGIILGAIVGFVNGFVVTNFRVPSFIVTLAMQSITMGIIYLYPNGNNVYEIGQFKVLGQGTLGFLPIPILIMIFIWIGMIVLLRYMKFGRYAYAVGGNIEAARASGINVKQTKLIAFVISGALAGLGGIVLMSRLNAGIPDAGIGYETDAIMAAVVGGTSFTGGSGTASGTMIGSFIIGILNNIMNQMGVEPYIQRISKGLLIIIAVAIDVKTKSKKGGTKILT